MKQQNIGIDGMKSYAGNANSIADSVLSVLYDHKLADNISKNAKAKVKSLYNWNKIAQDTHFVYQKAICQTMAEKQKNQIAQENARKTKKVKTKGTLLTFRGREALAQGDVNMNVYDTANKLAQELKTSTEYLDYKKIKEELDRSPEVKAKIREFEEKRYSVQLEALKGEEQEKSKLEEMQKIYIELMQDELARTYFEVELKFNVLIADVNKIIAESVQDVIKQIIEYSSAQSTEEYSFT